MRMRQAFQLLQPTARAMSWHPPLWAGALGLAYVAKEAPGAYIGHRILVLRVAVLLLCMGTAFVLDDPTEETIGHVPTPLVMRRTLRVVLVLPLVSTMWFVMSRVAGTVPAREGGPMPIGDLTIEAATLLAIALTSACVGAKLTADRLGGIVAAPAVFALIGIAMFLPPDQRMILGSPADARWEDAHDWWAAVLAGVIVCFGWFNRAPGSPPLTARMHPFRRSTRPA